MSLLDMDEKIIALAEAADLVYSPVVDPKDFPEGVDVTLVEGAVSSEEDLHKIQTIRQRTKIFISLGDCAVTGNVPSMRNPFEVSVLLKRAYQENTTYPENPMPPTEYVPALRPQVRPVHEVVKVDLFLPGCPPPAEAIFFVVAELLAGRTPDASQMTRFGK
jgi:NAD-reducing hydrogenase small subunit